MRSEPGHRIAVDSQRDECCGQCSEVHLVFVTRVQSVTIEISLRILSASIALRSAEGIK